MAYRIVDDGGIAHQVPRVTEIIRAGMPKPSLHAWQLAGTVERGSAVHRFIAAVLTGGPIPALLASQSGYKVAFTNWLVETGSVGFPLVEQTLCNGTLTVAGIADCITAGGHLYDWKTAERHGPLWPDQVAQLGAYASMTHLVDADGRVCGEAPVIHTASIVRLCADGTHETHTLAGADLVDAISLWHAVAYVAKAISRDNTDADTKGQMP